MKKTKREMFNEMLTLAITDEQRDFINHELELLNKERKNKKTKTQTENEAIKETILDTLTKDGKTITALIKENEELSEFSNQKISSLITQLVDNGLVERYEEKNKAYFRKVGE